MSFNSILFDHTDYLSHTDPSQVQAPEFFIDLNLDQIIDQITSGKEEYDLKPFFQFSLNDLDSIRDQSSVCRISRTRRALYTRYAPSIMGLCYRYSNCKADAEEILQESFIKAFQNLHRLNDPERFEWWLKRIAVN